MAYRAPSNRRLTPQNSKVVNTAIDLVNRVSPIAQERYANAFAVNGYSCTIYNKLYQGRICSCTKGHKKNDMLPILDEEGNASQQFITQLISGGQDFGISEYGSTKNTTNTDQINKTDFLEEEAPKVPGSTGAELDSITTDFIEEDYGEEIESNLGIMTQKCSVCFGTGFVGGFNVPFHSRITLDATYPKIKYYGAGTDKRNNPFTFNLMAANSYVEFEVTLPKDPIELTALECWANTEKTVAVLEIANKGDEEFTGIENIMSFCNGLPVVIRASAFTTLTHIELQFRTSSQDTYLEYPRVTKTGDLSVLDATQGVSINVSPLIPKIDAWSVIVDNTLGKVWRVTSVTDFKDRHNNIHGWDVEANLVQEYEVFNLLPSTKTNQRQLTTRFNRW